MKIFINEIQPRKFGITSIHGLRKYFDYLLSKQAPVNSF